METENNGYKFKYYRVMGRKYGLMYRGTAGEWPQQMICRRKESEAPRLLKLADIYKEDSFK